MIRMSASEANKKLGCIFKTGKSKYNNKKTIIDNKKFDSESEGKLYWDLKMQERQGLIKGFEDQVKESLEAYGKPICNYYVDFLVFHNDGTREYIEHKGIATKDWRIKWKMLLAKYDKEISKGLVVCSINWHRGYTIKVKK